MSADTLTVGCKRNVKPELAEAKGKRLIIAAELEEGMRLSTSNVKQLCSTDEIYAEKKYKDPSATCQATRWCSIPTICRRSAQSTPVPGGG